jgi:hypothetical protein
LRSAGHGQQNHRAAEGVRGAWVHLLIPDGSLSVANYLTTFIGKPFHAFNNRAKNILGGAKNYFSNAMPKKLMRSAKSAHCSMQSP